MKLLVAALVAFALASPPSLAIESAATAVTCAASITTGIGGNQALHDLDPSELPVLAYASKPKEREFKQLAKFGGVPIRLYVYRVNEQVMHMQIFEQDGEAKAVLADTPLQGDMAELTYRPLGGHEMVTVYCY